jgi:hypothetical protein
MNNLYVFGNIRWCLRKKRGVRFARLARSRYANLAEYTEARKSAGRTAGRNPFGKKFPNTPPVRCFLRPGHLCDTEKKWPPGRSPTLRAPCAILAN